MANYTSRDSKTASHNSASPLLSLPGEIRNEIYEYVLGQGVYKIMDDTNRPRTYESDERFALLQVCREIHNETKLLPFSLNTLSFNLNAFYKFTTKNSTTEQRQAIRAR